MEKEKDGGRRRGCDGKPDPDAAFFALKSIVGEFAAVAPRARPCAPKRLPIPN